MKIFFPIIFALFFLNCFAYELPRIHIFHINGVATSRTEAYNNMVELEKDAQIPSQFLVSAYGAGHFDLLYNQTHGKFLDVFWDTLGKKFKEGQSVSLDDYAKSYMEKNPDKAVPESSPAYAQLKLDIESEYKNIYFSQTNFDDLIDQFHGKVPAKFSPLLSYLKSFQESGTIDYKNESMDYILLLPHSQGNLYANDIYDWLTKNENFYKNNITLFGIADPASYINGQYGSNYITADNDWNTTIFSDK